MNSATSKSAVLLIHCPDQKGIVISITEFIFKNGGNILYLDQHVDTERQVFFMRIEWDLSDFMIAAGKIGEYFQTSKVDSDQQFGCADQQPGNPPSGGTLLLCLS